MRKGFPTTSPSIWVGPRQVDQAQDTLSATLALVRRRLPFLALWVAGFVVCGVVYAKAVRPDFIATTQILLQPRVIVNDGPEALRHFEQFRIDGEQCETELRILQSTTLLLQVFKALNIANASGSYDTPDGFWSFLGAQLDRLVGTASVGSDSSRTFYAFASRMRSRRLGLSYVIEISYRASSPDRAVSVANSIASAYAAHRIRGALAREQARGIYREERLAKLHTQLLAAEAGMQLGTIPDGNLADADIRLLGAADLPLGIIYPKMTPILMFTIVFGAVTGLLIVITTQGKSSIVKIESTSLPNLSGISRVA